MLCVARSVLSHLNGRSQNLSDTKNVKEEANKSKLGRYHKVREVISFGLQTQNLNKVILISYLPWSCPCLLILREGLLLMRGEALQSHYCQKVGRLSHVSLHAQSRWVTAVIGIMDYATL